MPEVKDHLYYSIDIDAYHLVFLNSQDEFHADSRWGNIFLARLSEAQMKWLEKDLEDHRDMDGIIVFSHIPLWYNGSGWRRVHELLRRYPVSAVIAGHFHYDQDDGEIDGIRYVVVGATGGHLKQAHPDAGGIQHVTVMTVADNRPEFELIAVETQQAMNLTPRVDMDRIQALDQMLYGLWSFDQKNRLVMKNRKLLASCETDEPAVIRLQCVGNPIDVPVRLTVTVDAEAVQMVSAGFLPAAGLTPVSDTECLLAPGERIATANLSSVKLRENLKPLWSARLALIEDAFTDPSKIVKVTARVSFAVENRGNCMSSGRPLSGLLPAMNGEPFTEPILNTFTDPAACYETGTHNFSSKGVLYDQNQAGRKSETMGPVQNQGRGHRHAAQSRIIPIGKPRLVELGPVVDISWGGLAVHYIDNKKRRIESSELSISFPPEGIVLEGIPFEMVSDTEIAELPDSKKIRRRSMKFGEMNQSQKTRLVNFLQNFTQRSS